MSYNANSSSSGRNVISKGDTDPGGTDGDIWVQTSGGGIIGVITRYRIGGIWINDPDGGARTTSGTGIGVGLSGSQYFTSSGTFTPGAGITLVQVVCVGGGGGGGHGNSASVSETTVYGAGGTGGFGVSAVKLLTVVPGTGYGIVIGTGGAVAGIGAGFAGTSTTFAGTLCVSTGGGGGAGGAAPSPGANGTPGVGTVCDYQTSTIVQPIDNGILGFGGVGSPDSYTAAIVGQHGFCFISW